MPYCYPLLSAPYEKMLAEVGNKSGTYRLRLWNEQRDGYTPLPRLLDVDTDGVLYIGTSEEKIVSRVDELRHAVANVYNLQGFNRSKHHTCANAIREQFVEKILPERLCIEMTTYEGLHIYQNYTIEWHLLADYFAKFGEFPPLNGLKPDKVSHIPATPPANSSL